MSLIDISKQLTLENIYKKISQKDIYKRYFQNNFQYDKNYSAPYRSDENPSFKIFENSDQWYDFGTGKTGDSIDLMKLIFNLSFGQVLDKINTDFNLGLSRNLVVSSKPNGTRGILNNSFFEKECKIAKFTFKHFVRNDVNCKYWKDKYSISVEDLKMYNIYPTAEVFLNDKSMWQWNSKNPIFTYVFKKEDSSLSFKIYRPLETNPKAHRFAGNTGGNTIQGLEQLPKETDLLILSKSYKDVICLKKLGFWAVAPNAESIRITDEWLDKIKRKCNYQKIITFYDNDQPGIDAAMKVNEIQGFDFAFIPTEIGAKDISDYIEMHGLEKAKILVNKLLT